MNFSYMKKVSKLLSLILVLVLMSTLFAGCWKKDTTPEDTSGPGLNLNLSDTPLPIHRHSRRRRSPLLTRIWQPSSVR